MPKTLDVLIGVSVIMLVVSMTVTILTQFLTTLFNTRGRGLKKGIETLIAQIDPGLKNSAGRIAGAVLMNPLIAEPMSRLGTVIHRDELVRLLLELAAGQGQIKLNEADKKALSDALVENGIANPAATLGHLRLVAMQIEAARPDLATNVCRDFAILQGARSNFVGKVNGWFDQTIDRVSARFTMGARGITFACALAVAFGLQLDTIGIVNTLWINDALRERLVTEAAAVENPNSTEATGTTAVPAKPQAQYLDQLATYGLITMPNPGSWRAELYPIKIPGILLSTLLLSLGAPFWYNALKNLLRMRTVMAENDDLQRISRQKTDPSLAPSLAPPEHSEPPPPQA
ncbi:MAG TPA: hypothetical protein VEU51_04340 [Candidatus Acidoferrales bacterium]|nr:hypothetical protein [Candidatus Acidoferrales bacterium]